MIVEKIRADAYNLSIGFLRDKPIDGMINKKPEDKRYKTW